MKKILSLLIVLCIIEACSNADDYVDLNQENPEKMLELIEKYNLQRVDPAEYEFLDIQHMPTISSPEQLEMILNKTNIVEEIPCDDSLLFPITRSVPASESGQRVIQVTGTNEDGTAVVYVDLNAPAVVNSTYQLGLMDAFLDYKHMAGSASRSGNRINFTAYGEGWVKLIYEGIELYKYNVSIEGYCSSDGSEKKLTKF